MVTILPLHPPWPVHTPFGEGSALLYIHNGVDHNPELFVRCEGGIPRCFFIPDVRIYGNPMDGNGFDVDIPKDWKP